jgi:hypothetical protein
MIRCPSKDTSQNPIHNIHTIIKLISVICLFHYCLVLSYKEFHLLGHVIQPAPVTLLTVIGTPKHTLSWPPALSSLSLLQ